MQRLVTGSENVDKDETTRTAELAKGLHALAKGEGVAVVMLSDSSRPPAVTAEGRSTASELSFRGSYVINHVAGTTLYLEIGDEFYEMFPELSKGGSYKGHGTPTVKQEQLVERVQRALKDFPLQGPGHAYQQDYQSQYAAVLCSKRRWQEPFSPFFHYHKAIKCFEQLPV